LKGAAKPFNALLQGRWKRGGGLLAGRGFAYEAFNQRNVTGFAESLRHCLTLFCCV
jgi:hypothetical protein